MNTAPELLDFVKSLVPKHYKKPVDENTSLFASSVLDSMNMIALITHVESQYGVTVAPSEVSLENFDTVERIAEYVRKAKAK